MRNKKYVKIIFHHLHRRQQGQDGLRPEIVRFGLQKEPWLQFRPRKAETASHHRRAHAQLNEGFQSLRRAMGRKVSSQQGRQHHQQRGCCLQAPSHHL